MGQRVGRGESGCRECQGEEEGKSLAAGQRDRDAQDSEALKKPTGQRGQPGVSAEVWAGTQGKAVEWKC